LQDEPTSLGDDYRRFKDDRAARFERDYDAWLQ
jgi:hypothetical protein